jgi:hypothetical protein
MNNDNGGLSAWLADDSDPDPFLGPVRTNGVRTNGVGVLLDDAAVSGEGAAELEAMRAELALTRARARLQSDPAWLDEMSADEWAQERRAAETIRGMHRERDLAAAMSRNKLGGREQRMDDRLERMELSDRLWSRRAQARRMRLLDPTARLASLQRTHAASSGALGAVAIAGIAWTSIGVHDALVGPGGNPVAYVVEPIFSVPLLVIMGLSARAAQFGREFPPRPQRARVYALEVFLLAATISMNTVSVLPGMGGTWHNLATLLAHLVPPVLIVIAVALQPLVAGFLAEILTDAQVGAESVPPRLDGDAVEVLTLVARVRTAMARGDLSAWADTGLPSITSIQRYLRCEKRRAQSVGDALRILTGTSEIRAAKGVWR